MEKIRGEREYIIPEATLAQLHEVVISGIHLFRTEDS